MEKIAPERDSTAIAAAIPRLLSAAVPKPVFYYNYNVGECRDLIFGVSLVDYATARGLPEGEVPKIIRICIQDIEQRGLDAEGIYRVSLTCRVHEDNGPLILLTVGIGEARSGTGGMLLYGI